MVPDDDGRRRLDGAGCAGTVERATEIGRMAVARSEGGRARLRAWEERSGDLFEEDRARLAADLDAAKARERALEEVAAEASAALGRAAAEVRAALAAGEG